MIIILKTIDFLQISQNFIRGRQEITDTIKTIQITESNINYSNNNTEESADDVKKILDV